MLTFDALRCKRRSVDRNLIATSCLQAMSDTLLATITAEVPKLRGRICPPVLAQKQVPYDSVVLNVNGFRRDLMVQ